MDYLLAFAENDVPSTMEPDPYIHVFLDAGNDNVMAFFELPNSPQMSRDPNTPEWVQHIAFALDTMEELNDAKAHLEGHGLDVLGPVDHGLFDSIYFFDPNGHRLEFAVDKGTTADRDRARAVADEMLEEWSRTKRAPRQAAWLHEGTLNP